MATTELAPARPAERWGGSLVEWIATVDHKKIGLLYTAASLLFFLMGGVLAMLIRTELAEPGLQVMGEASYNQTFTMHGTVMIFLFSVPIFTGLGNYLVPLQIGAADVAFPRLNALSFWLFLFGGLVVITGWVSSGDALQFGWTAYAPLSLETFSQGIGPDLWVLGLAVTGIASVIAAVNLLTTIFNLRMPGMTMFRLPLFTWGIITQQLMILLAFPSLTAALAMLFLDRHFGATFFDPRIGGDPVLWQHMFWFFGHPEVYVVAIPAFGIISEVLPVFSRKPIFGYRTLVLAFFGIASLSFSVWAHHMFTTGQVNLLWFSVMTFLIAVPTGIKFFNWIGTMWRGKLRFPTPMLFALGFLPIFLIGGITGIFLASPPIDFQVHDTYYVVAHFHFTMLAALQFGLFAGLYFWFPKMFGRMLSDRIGKWHFWLWFIGFVLTFLPQFQLGLNGMPRRIADYSVYARSGWTALNRLSSIGAAILAVAGLLFIWNVVVSLTRGKLAGDDPWQANSLEWATSSPPPAHNFRALPEVHSERPVYDLRRGLEHPETGEHTDPQTKPHRG
ncbi:MAG TPA: cytochrome c oxidase subunit I [Actinomycetes bacterium]